MKVSGVGKATLNRSRDKTDRYKAVRMRHRHEEGSVLSEARQQFAQLPEVDEQRIAFFKARLQKGEMAPDVTDLAVAMVAWYRSQDTLRK